MRHTLPSVTVFALLLALLLIPAAAGAAPGGGNSPGAKACQKGGYSRLGRADGTPFAGEADCVSYAAQGGTLLPRPAATITGIASTVRTFDGVQLIAVSGTGFLPEAPLTFDVVGENVLANNLNGSPYVFTDAAGTFDSATTVGSTNIIMACAGGTLTVTASDGTSTATATATIPTCPPVE